MFLVFVQQVQHTIFFVGFVGGVSEDFPGWFLLVNGEGLFLSFFRDRKDRCKQSKSSAESLRVLARHHNWDASAGARNVFHIARLSVT